MATSVQTLPLTRDPSKTFRDPYSTPTRPTALLDRCSMGSVGSLVERPDASPAKGSRAVPQVGPRQTNRLLKKSFNQRELLNYLNITRKDVKADSGPGSSRKDIFSSMQSINREHGHEEEHIKLYHKDGTEVDVSKNSLPIRGKYEKSRLRPSAFQPITPKNFSSMQNLYPSKMEDSDQNLSNGLHRAYAHTPRAGSTSSSSSSPSRHGGPTSSGTKVVASVRGLSQEDENLSDSGHNSMNSLPPYRSPFRPHLAHISASMGHINTIGSLDRASKVAGSSGVAMAEMAMSCQEVVRDLEERLVEKEHELKQMGEPGWSEGAIAQLLQLYKAQQEKNRLQEELDALRGDRQREGQGSLKGTSPTLEETRWQVCQKSGEISLLKQQLRDSQAEVTCKLSELFQLKTQLRESRGELQSHDGQIDALQTALQGAQPRRQGKVGAEENGTLESRGSGGASGPTEERLRAELLLERRQSEAQATAFEEERQTWQTEKEKVIRYQRELQASYLDMYHHNKLLEREVYQLRGRGGGGERGGGGTLERELQDVRGGRGGEGGGREMGDYSNESLEREVQEVRRGRGGGEEDSKPPLVFPG
ncbi:hypothetical protein J4Q44_G00307430 [Coregonus suidteri]|uniref:Uncharacterized protein n=1 Tax=Coregonus suidteri TaxID=861788 RepID=A0AAN8KWJ1_9TELE